MSRGLLIAIIVVLLIVVAVGLYLIFGNQVSLPGTQNPNSFNIQGMKVEVLQQGSGVAAKSGDLATVHYVGVFQDGKEFDSSVGRNAPFSFYLGQERVIKGWDLGITGMKVGEKRKLTIPPELGYGLEGFPPFIPRSSTLIFTVELLGINALPNK